MLETIFELGINAIEELIIIDFVSRYLGFKYNDKRKVIGFIIGWFVSFAEVTIMNYITFLKALQYLSLS